MPTFPVYSDEGVFADHREVDIRFESGDAILSGTLYLPQTAGPHPAVVIHPGSAWTVRSPWDQVAFVVGGVDVAAFSWDKRGQGASTGSCCPSDEDVLFDLLAGDVVAAARAVGGHQDIRVTQVGVVGSSFGGWIVPLAANAARADIAFTVSTVGGVVSTGQEVLYDQLTGLTQCQVPGTPMEEIVEQLKAAGPSGFDPRSSLEALTQPGLWAFGGRDYSHPTLLAVEILEEITAALPKDWTILVFPNANHDFVENGAICQTDGPNTDVIPALREWFDRVLAR